MLSSQHSPVLTTNSLSTTSPAAAAVAALSHSSTPPLTPSQPSPRHDRLPRPTPPALSSPSSSHTPKFQQAASRQGATTTNSSATDAMTANTDRPSRHSPPPATSIAPPAAAATATAAPATNAPKVISRNFFECSTGDILVLVSSMLQELVNLNDALPFDSSQLTRFHSRSPPSISIKGYLLRITKFCSLEKSILLAMIYYIDLLCTTYKIFNINSLTVHRFLITAAMVASKGLCDTFCTNTHYAKVGGLSKVELNSLEVEFLIRVDYRIVPEGERLAQYYERMVTRMRGRYVFPPRPAASSKAPPNRPPSQPYKPGTFLPSELAHQEGRVNCSSPLKRPSVDLSGSDVGSKSVANVQGHSVPRHFPPPHPARDEHRARQGSGVSVESDDLSDDEDED